MEFWSTIAGLVRRPVVIIPTIMMALTLGAVAYLGTPETQVSSTTMVLTTTEYGGSQSQDPAEPTQLTNPMLNFNASLQTTAAILIQTLGTREVREELGATSGDTQLIVNDGRTDPDLLGLNGPFLYIEGRSASAEDARRVVVGAQRLMVQKLGEWQRALNAPQRTYVSLVDVVPPTAPEPDSGRAVKLGLLASVFGCLLCLGIAYGGHQVRARRLVRDTGTTRSRALETSASTAVKTKVREPMAVGVAASEQPRSTPPAPRKGAGSSVAPVPVKLNGRSRKR